MFRKKTARKISIKRRSPKPRKNSRLLEMAIVAIFALVVIYGASFAIRITHGLSRTIDTPEYTVRLQVLNGCGTDGAAGHVAKEIPILVGLPLEVNIVEVADFESYHVMKSFLISREKDMTAARMLAGQLGLDFDEIVYEPIANNYRSTSVTLVLGEDFEELIQKPQE